MALLMVDDGFVAGDRAFQTWLMLPSMQKTETIRFIYQTLTHVTGCNS
jgi:hypothetical protein